MVQNDNFMIENDIGTTGTVFWAHLRSLEEVEKDQVPEKARKAKNHCLQKMANVFQNMSPGIVKMSSTDKRI